MTEPAAPRRPRAAGDLADQLRRCIAERGLSAYSVAAAAGLNPAVVSRFVAGTRDLKLETAGRICAALGLKLADALPRGRGRPRAGRPPGRRGGPDPTTPAEPA